MARRLTWADTLLLLLIFPVATGVAALHVFEVARSGLAQLPVYATPARDGGYPLVGGHRLETELRGTPLRVGDRLLRVGSRDLRGVGYVGFDAIALAEAGPAGEAPLIYERNGIRHTASLPAVPHPYPWSRLPNLLLLPMCALVLLRAPGSRDAQRFCAAFTVYALLQLQFYGGPEWRTLTSLWLWNLISPVGVVLMLRFARLFPTEVPPEQRTWWGWPWLAGASYLAVRINYLTGFPLPPDWVPRVSYASHSAYLIGTLAILGWNFVHAQPIGRRRLKWILLGATLGSLPLMVVQLVPLVAPDWSGFETAFAVGSSATVFWMVGVLIAVVRYNVFDIDRLIGATAAYSSLVIAGLGALLAGVPFLADLGSAWLGIDDQIVRLALAMSLAAVAIPLGRRLRRGVDRLLFPERAALESGVESLLQELSRCTEPSAVLACAADRVPALLRPRGSALYVREGGAFLRHRGAGLALPEVLGPEDPRLAARSGTPEGAGDAEVSFALPIHSGSAPAAVLLLGPKRSGDVYTSSDRGLLSAIAEKASGELLRFQKEASDELARARSRLLATASHDIRQPLHALGFMLESLSGKVEGDDAHRLVRRIQSSTQDLSQMLTDLLDLSKLESGALRAAPRAFALAPLLQSLEEEFAPSALEAGLLLRVEPSALHVESDRLLLLRILRNLLSNAIRYTGAGGVVVAARVSGERVWIDVSDTGPGIPEASHGEIFQEFRQLEPRSPASDAGLGLGLAIVQRLAELLGHELEVRSAPGQGSRFSVAVPLASRDAAAAAHTAEIRALANPLSGRRIAVVDDDPSVLEATRELLASWGCEVRTAADAREAQGLLAPGWAPDFVLADYHLSERESGLEVIARLRRAVGAALPAALVTADTAPDHLEEMRATGFPVLQKPLAPARLRAVLTHALAARSA
jgi:signal transduction histidine kinase/CheY-like chemotaxis protein